ncbi:uroporphyrinogen-III C-methyltransferase [Draconibacterium sediminis]|uniref:uroporphyrinogen-III C-methyltransferase n=1 Tax=Draconibacterium sediminis TaxID=1544798 RepID=UPI0026EDACBF|nr:uroporphyrinogen-III C-methyltransferase [Draconibacterium sediminis]
MEQLGKVYIVGAGPGPADLLTVKAHNCIKEADVILYDALISRDVRALFPENAELIFVGKRAGDGVDVTERQNSIHHKIEKHAKQGKVVVRVKSGDPMIFSRGAEETSYLQEKNIPFEVVPGISAFNAASAEFGIPLTDRRGSNSLHLLSGRDVAGKLLSVKQLVSILENRGTAVIYMGTKVLEEIYEALDAVHRECIQTTIVSRSGRWDAEKFKGTLEEMVSLNSETPVKTPALIYLRMEC